MNTNQNNTINGVSIYDLSHTGLVMGAIARSATGEGEELNELAAQSTPFPQIAVDAINVLAEETRDTEWRESASGISCGIEEAMIEKAKELDALCMTYKTLGRALHPDHI
jgi:hypothetical protein